MSRPPIFRLSLARILSELKADGCVNSEANCFDWKTLDR
jgi:hypothetical protein